MLTGVDFVNGTKFTVPLPVTPKSDEGGPNAPEDVLICGNGEVF